MKSLIGMMPGMGKMASKLDSSKLEDKSIKHQIALIQAMTKKERVNPLILQASRKKRISNGSGLEVSELNRLLKMHRQMSDMMKKMGKSGNKGMLRGMMGQMMGNGASLPQIPTSRNNQKETNLTSPFDNLSNLGLPQNLSGFGKKK
jgi:signal recognition particle subunit SRP54